MKNENQMLNPNKKNSAYCQNNQTASIETTHARITRDHPLVTSENIHELEDEPRVPPLYTWSQLERNSPFDQCRVSSNI